MPEHLARGALGPIMITLSATGTHEHENDRFKERHEPGAGLSWGSRLRSSATAGCRLRSCLLGGLARGFCVAACWMLLVQGGHAFESNKLLTEHTHTVWTHKDGLPSAFIYSIAQTQDGYLWLGTADALVRFDGVRFVHWRPKTGYKRLLGVVHIVYAARDGSLWVGTASGLVGHIRGDDLEVASVGAPPQGMLEDRDGTIWVAIERGLLRFNGSIQEQVGTAIALPSPFLSGPLQDRRGAIWMSTNNSVLRVDPHDPQGRLMKMTDGKFWLSEDTNGVIWMTRPDGATHQISEERMFNRTGFGAKTLNVHTVLRDSKGNTWIGTLGQGLARLRAPVHDMQRMERYSQPNGLSTEFVWCLLEDREHNIWVGTQNGLNRFRDEKITTLTRAEGLMNDDVGALAAGIDGSVWVSTSAGIVRIDGEHRNLYLEDVSTMGLSVERTGRVWTGTKRGIESMKDGKWAHLPSPAGTRLTDVTAITEDDENGIWLVDARKGLYRWGDGRLTNFSQEPLLKGKSILVARPDHRGNLWLGLYEGGVVVFDGSQFRAYSERDGLAGGFVDAVLADQDGTVWIGAERGLSRFRDQTFVTWNIANGLPQERVLWVLDDSDGGIWLGYSIGVVRVDRAELDRSARDRSYRVAYSFFDDGDGLKGNPDRRWQSPAVRATDGKLWFRTSEGVAVLDPQHLTRNPVPPPVHVERMVADGVAVDTARPVRLHPLTRDVEIDYTGVSLAEPRKVLFRYKLEGFDSDWQEAGMRRQAFYTNLPPHAYRFRVLACNNDGVWSESDATLGFDLLPAFYQTQWFRLLCGLTLIMLAWAAYRLRVWQLTARMRDRFEERLQERTRIAQELHDSLIQDVMGISLQIELTDELLRGDPVAKQSLARALGLCKSALEAGRRALKDLRSVALSAADIVKSFSQLSEEFAQDGGPEVDVIVEGNERALNAATGNDVLQVGRQAIANAFQHAHASRIHVLLSYGEQHLRIRIQDNGCGINEETLNVGRPGHYGIAGMQERAERLGGIISIRSRLGEGTEVDLYVPAHLIYQHGVSGSDRSFADRWRYAVGRLKARKQELGPTERSAMKTRSEAGKPGESPK
jgi:signal transduction histidine kinase/ligand-binding sensor domain-containing protein